MLEIPVTAGERLNIVDILCTSPSKLDFAGRVQRLQLPETLESKVLSCHDKSMYGGDLSSLSERLCVEDENTLATEVLYYRHRFTCCLFKSQKFRQAAISVIQNTYLFQNRHIFFNPEGDNQEAERQEALDLFSSSHSQQALPVDKSLRHPILARIWNRIVNKMDREPFRDPVFLELHSVVESLNTLRNIYLLFCSRLVKKLAAGVNPVYRQSVSYEDSVQIGSFGIARAAYRYHPSCGVRFSTYASKWFYKEIQRQSLAGRLVRVSSNIVEEYAKALKRSDDAKAEKLSAIIDEAACDLSISQGEGHGRAGVDLSLSHQAASYEDKQVKKLLHETIEKNLSKKNADIVKRRYGFWPYDQEQSVIEIAKAYGVTRSSIYQIEQTVMSKLKKHLQKHIVTA